MATTWDSAYKFASITLDATNKIATMPNTGGSHVVRATQGYSTGKRYFEVVLSLQAGYSALVGLVTGAYDVTIDSNGMGASPDAWAYNVIGASAYLRHNYVMANVSVAVTGNTIGVAVDFDAHTARWYLNGELVSAGYWNDSDIGIKEIFPAIGGYSWAGSGKFADASFTYTPPAGYSAWDATAAPANVTIDTLRQTSTSASVTADTLRMTSKPASVAVDTLRVTTSTAPASVSIDTLRRTSKPQTVTVDTSRRRSVPAGKLVTMGISLQSGVLADQYAIEQLIDAPLSTAYAGTLYGWLWGYTVRSKSYTPATKRTTLQGDYDISEALKKYITFDGETGAAQILGSVAAQLGKSLNINIDGFNVLALSPKTTVMQVLQNLFSWTSAVPHRFINVFLRGGVLNVLQRGKETSTYTLQKYDIKQTTEKLLDTLMDESDDSPVIMGDSPEAANIGSRYYSGTFAFGGAVVTFSNGLCIQAITTDGTTTTTTVNSYSGQYIAQSAVLFSAGEASTNSVTDYSYGTYNGLPYLSSAVTIDRKGSSSPGAGTIESEDQINYYPIGFERYGARETGYTYKYDKDGVFVSKSKKTERDSIAEGRPGGPASPYTLANAQKSVAAPSVPIARNPISSSHIPVTDTGTLQNYATGLEWLDGKTEYGLTVDCFDAHVVDFDQTVTVCDAVWYLQSNQITVAPNGTRQSLNLVRWA